MAIHPKLKPLRDKLAKPMPYSCGVDGPDDCLNFVGCGKPERCHDKTGGICRNCGFWTGYGVEEFEGFIQRLEREAAIHGPISRREYVKSVQLNRHDRDLPQVPKEREVG